MVSLRSETAKLLRVKNDRISPAAWFGVAAAPSSLTNVFWTICSSNSMPKNKHAKEVIENASWGRNRKNRSTKLKMWPRNGFRGPKSEKGEEEKRDLGFDRAFDEWPEARHGDDEEPQRGVVAGLGIPDVAGRRGNVEEKRRVGEEGEASDEGGRGPATPPRSTRSWGGDPSSQGSRVREKRRWEERAGHCHYHSRRAMGCSLLHCIANGWTEEIKDYK